MLSIVLHSPLTSSLLGPNISLSTCYLTEELNKLPVIWQNVQNYKQLIAVKDVNEIISA